MFGKEDRVRQQKNMRVSLAEVNDVRLEREAGNKKEVANAMDTTNGRLIGVAVVFTYFAPYGFDSFVGIVCGVTKYQGSTFLMIREWNDSMNPIVVEDIYVKEVK